MRATAVAFSFNAPRFISCVGPLIAGTLIVSLGGYGPAATIVGLFFILGLVAAPFLARDQWKTAARDLVAGPRRLAGSRRGASSFTAAALAPADAG